MVKKLYKFTTIYFNIEGDDTQYGYVEFYYHILDDNGVIMSTDLYRLQPSTDYSGYEETVRTLCDAAFSTMSQCPEIPESETAKAVIQ